MASIAKYRYKKPAGKLGVAHTKSSGLGDITKIEPRVVSGSVHSLRLLRLRVCVSHECVTVFSYSGLLWLKWLAWLIPWFFIVEGFHEKIKCSLLSALLFDFYYMFILG